MPECSDGQSSGSIEGPLYATPIGQLQLIDMLLEKGQVLI